MNIKSQKKPVVKFSHPAIKTALEKITRQSTSTVAQVKRAKILLLLAEGEMSISQIARAVKCDRSTITRWRDRYLEQEEAINSLVKVHPPKKGSRLNKKFKNKIRSILLNDKKRSGRPSPYSNEQIAALVKIACSHPQDYGHKRTSWTYTLLAETVIKENVFEYINAKTVWKLLDNLAIKPHKSKVWLFSSEKEKELASFMEKVRNICHYYQMAPTLAQVGVYTICIDEKTGIQIVAPNHPGKPVAPGRPALKEHGYTRRGHLDLIQGFRVDTGEPFSPYIAKTHKEKDFLAALKQIVATDPTAEFVFICDNFSTHVGESIVRWVASECKIRSDLGEKRKRGILFDKASRAKFLSQPYHRIRFVFTPKHSSWLNQVEIWFSVLERRLLKNGEFHSEEELREALEGYIDEYIERYAHPYKWTYSGKGILQD